MFVDLPARARTTESQPANELPIVQTIAEDVLSADEEAKLDRSLSPCESFYDYACGGVLRTAASAPTAAFVMPEADRKKLARSIVFTPSASKGSRAAASFFQLCQGDYSRPAAQRARLYKLESRMTASIRPNDASGVLRAAAAFERRGAHIFFSVRTSDVPTPGGKVAIELTPYLQGTKITAADVAKATRAVGIDDESSRTTAAAVERVQRLLSAGAPTRDFVRFDGRTPDPRVATYLPALTELGIKDNAPLATHYAEYFLALPARINTIAASDLHAYFSYRLAELALRWTPTGDADEWIDTCARRTVDLFHESLRADIATRVELPMVDQRHGIWFTRVRDALRVAVEKGELVATPRATWIESLAKVQATFVRQSQPTLEMSAIRPPFLVAVTRVNASQEAKMAQSANTPFSDRVPLGDPFALMPEPDRPNKRVVYPPASLSLRELEANVPLVVTLGAFGPPLGEVILTAARPTGSATSCDPAELRAATHAGVLRALLAAFPTWSSEEPSTDPVLLRRHVLLAFAQSQCGAAPDIARIHVNRTLATLPTFQADYACKVVPVSAATCSAL